MLHLFVCVIIAIVSLDFAVEKEKSLLSNACYSIFILKNPNVVTPNYLLYAVDQLINTPNKSSLLILINYLLLPIFIVLIYFVIKLILELCHEKSNLNLKLTSSTLILLLFIVYLLNCKGFESCSYATKYTYIYELNIWYSIHLPRDKNLIFLWGFFCVVSVICFIFISILTLLSMILFLAPQLFMCTPITFPIIHYLVRSFFVDGYSFKITQNIKRDDEGILISANNKITIQIGPIWVEKMTLWKIFYGSLLIFIAPAIISNFLL